MMPDTFILAPEVTLFCWAATGTTKAASNTARGPNIDSFFITSSYGPRRGRDLGCINRRPSTSTINRVGIGQLRIAFGQFWGSLQCTRLGLFGGEHPDSPGNVLGLGSNNLVPLRTLSFAGITATVVLLIRQLTKPRILAV